MRAHRTVSHARLTLAAKITSIICAAAFLGSTGIDTVQADELVTAQEIIELIDDLQHESSEALNEHHRARKQLVNLLRSARHHVTEGSRAWEAGNQKKAGKKFRKARHHIKQYKNRVKTLHRKGKLGHHESASLRNQARQIVGKLNKLISKKGMNDLPTANAGPDQSVSPGALVQLDGSSSTDPDGDSLDFEWQIITRPAGSQSVLSDSTSVMPTLVADVAGDYQIQLIVICQNWTR